MLTPNVGTLDKTLRITTGLVLLAFAIFAPTGTPYAWLGYIGIVPLATGLLGFCPLYPLIGLNTCPRKK
jgi:Protein of unknown function (DUF2892)